MVELSAALLAGIFAAQVAQLGFEARLLQRVTKVETKIKYVQSEDTPEETINAD